MWLSVVTLALLPGVSSSMLAPDEGVTMRAKCTMPEPPPRGVFMRAVAEGKKPVDKAESSQRRRANRRKRKKNAAEAATRRSTRKVGNLPSWMKDMTKKEKLAKKEAALAATE